MLYGWTLNSLHIDWLKTVMYSYIYHETYGLISIRFFIRNSMYKPKHILYAAMTVNPHHIPYILHCFQYCSHLFHLLGEILKQHFMSQTDCMQKSNTLYYLKLGDG